MKNKTKNIILGVSLGINILLALLVGGALIKSCNDAPTQTATTRRLGAGEASSSPNYSSLTWNDLSGVTFTFPQTSVSWPSTWSSAFSTTIATQYRLYYYLPLKIVPQAWLNQNYINSNYPEPYMFGFKREYTSSKYYYYACVANGPTGYDLPFNATEANYASSSNGLSTYVAPSSVSYNASVFHSSITFASTFVNSTPGNTSNRAYAPMAVADWLSWCDTNGVSYTLPTPEVSSSEDSSEVVSSSEETTEDLTSEQTSAATSEGQPVDPLTSGFTLRFGEKNPFSAWAINPYNEDPAIYYDSTAPFVLYSGTPSSETSTLVTAKYTLYEVGDFYVAGNPDAVYDTIALTTLNLSVDNYFVPNGSDEGVKISEEAYAKGAFIVSHAYYLNSATNDRVRVYAMGETSVQVGNDTIMALAGPAWTNVGFRDIVYIGDNPQIEINGYTAQASWWLENNALSSSAAVGSMLLGDATNGVFGLIGQAFSSVASIFGVALIPGLTIGTLLFIPLVVLIILAILRLLAK